MKRFALGVVLGALIASVSLLFAAPPQVKGLIDSEPPQSILFGVEKWFADHPIEQGKNIRAETVFKSPRMQVVLAAQKPGAEIGRHIHAGSEELVYIVKGEGQMYINGEWKPVKAGELHVCPRGMAHGTTFKGELQVMSVFAPPQAGGDDKVLFDKFDKER
jgi:quercetin dioxygenase-like cupin family protein